MKFNEDSRVKIPTILHLMCLGYNYLSIKDPSIIWDESTNIFTDIFHQSIKKVNPIITEIGAKLRHEVSLEGGEYHLCQLNRQTHYGAENLTIAPGYKDTEKGK